MKSDEDLEYLHTQWFTLGSLSFWSGTHIVHVWCRRRILLS